MLATRLRSSARRHRWRSLHAPVAELAGFPLAVIRKGAGATLQHAVRCLIVDDDHSFLEAARVLLEREGLAVAGVASASDEALRQVETLRPDVVIDISLGRRAAWTARRSPKSPAL